ncbi:dnaJ homolog subfamily C member 7-like [Dendronephthya gigantea]|uniref:dnaJ homolog subfamily C member 7-like n=1 Tax=Dendronephthya gigantea TaxID=151771 RepID=UPI00106ADFC0|nr:dnaJ homolog subfamily C member 7-like [Dendronephthya gigantea]
MSDDHNTNTPGYHVGQQLAESSVPLLKERSSDEWCILGMSLYYEGRVQAAFIAIIVNALRYNPNHETSRAFAPRLVTLKWFLDDARRAFENGIPLLAHRLYSQALDVDPMNKAVCANLYYKRGFIMCTLKMVPQAIMDFTEAIELDGSHLKAHLFRAKCYLAIGQYEKASKAYYEIFAMTGIPEYYRLSEEAYNAKCNLRFALFTLSLTEDCSVLDVKKAFRREARLHHPDRHAGASNKIQEREEETFKQVQRARQFLLDFLKRKNRFNNHQVWFSNTDYFEL